MREGKAKSWPTARPISNRWRSLNVAQLRRKTHRIRIEGIAAVRLEEARRAHHQNERQLYRDGYLGDSPHPAILGQLHFGGLDDTQLGRGCPLQMLLMLVQVVEGFGLHFLVETGFLSVTLVQRLRGAGS